MYTRTVILNQCLGIEAISKSKLHDVAIISFSKLRFYLKAGNVQKNHSTLTIP